ncbi:MAG: hypothetical protein H6618_05175 [Deltaproteobacteria bacterium]|nr:hypothetical protein [Deltaproteobacteria bacterium]
MTLSLVFIPDAFAQKGPKTPSEQKQSTEHEHCCEPERQRAGQSHSFSVELSEDDDEEENHQHLSYLMAAENVEALPDDELEALLSELYVSTQGDARNIDTAMMEQYVLGIKGQGRLMTFVEAWKERVLQSHEIGAIFCKVRTLSDGEIRTLHMCFGQYSGDEIIVGRRPAMLLEKSQTESFFNPANPPLGAFIKWLDLMGYMTWVRPPGPGSRASADSSSRYNFQYSLPALATSMSANYFSKEANRGFFGSANMNPFGTGVSVGTTGENSNHSLWYSVMSGWHGLGYSGVFNLEEQQLRLSALGVGAWAAGWKNYVQFGASLNAIFASGNQLGLGAVITLSKDRITRYLGAYQGEYDPLINRFIFALRKRKTYLKEEIKVTSLLRSFLEKHDLLAEMDQSDQEIIKIEKELKNIRHMTEQYKEELSFLHGKHLIEVVDTSSKGLALQGGAYINSPGIGFKSAFSKKRESVYRFYTELSHAQELLEDGSGDKIALIRLPEKLKKNKFPDLLKPHKWHVGEELVTTVEKKLSGSIVMGWSYLPGINTNVGISGTITGSFELGLRKLADNKLEMTFRPVAIKEMGAFVSMLGAVGPRLSASSSVALAMRQTFIFDLNNHQATDTYMLFISGGVLPLDFSGTANIIGPREAENLLDLARILRATLLDKGILLTYLEKIDIPAKKFYAGVGKIPCLGEKKWKGLSYEYLNGHAKVVSTNGDLAVTRNTSLVQESADQGYSGTRAYSAYATIKRTFRKTEREQDRVHISSDDSVADRYFWTFNGISLRARISDDKITGTEHNQMIDKINRMFHANIRRFPHESLGHKQTRDILLERELTSSDLDLFSMLRQSDLETAAHGSGVEKSVLTDLLAELENKGHNQKAEIIKAFIGEKGFSGVSAVHLMLHGNCRNLIIRTESDAYTAPLEEGRRLEALYITPDDSEKDRLLNLSHDSTASKVAEVYKNVNLAIKHLDQALKDLDEDPFYEEYDDLLRFEEGNLREKKCPLRSTLLAAKKRLHDLIHLEHQGFSKDTILKIYKNIPSKHRSLNQRVTILEDQYKYPISLNDRRKVITERWEAVSDLFDDITEEIRQLETEDSRRILGSVWTDKRIAEGHSLKKRAINLISLNHLLSCAEEFIAKMTKAQKKIFPARPVHFTIAGHVRQMLLGQPQELVMGGGG